MRILQINSVYGYGSTGKIVNKIHHELLDNGYESFVIYGRKGAIGSDQYSIIDNNCFYINNNIEMYSHVLKGLIFDKHGLYSKKNTRHILEKIMEIKPDIIHLHNIHGFYINYELLFEYIIENKIKVVWTLHDCWSFTGFCSHYDYNNCDKWKKNCKKCNYRDVYPYRILSNSKQNYELKRDLYNRMDDIRIVTPSKWLANQVSQSILASKPICVINNDVDLSNFYYDYDSKLREEYDLVNKTVLLAVSSIWTNRKGFTEYLKLAATLCDNYRLVMIGLDKKQIKKLPYNIIGIERTNSVDELRKWYSSSDIFLNLTLEDTYPTVNLEARACGLPIITYNTGGSPETIGNNGYVVEKYDLQGIHELLNNEKFDKFSETKENRMCVNYIDLYRELLHD